MCRRSLPSIGDFSRLDDSIVTEYLYLRTLGTGKMDGKRLLKIYTELTGIPIFGYSYRDYHASNELMRYLGLVILIGH